MSSTGGAGRVGLERLEQRALEQEALAVDVVRDRAGAERAADLGEADLEHLARVVPLVERRGDVEALVALQADEPPAERRGQHLGDLGLADAGLALEEERPAELRARGTRAVARLASAT